MENLLQNKTGKKSSENVPNTGNVIGFCTGDILVGNIRPYLKKIWFADCNGGTNGDVLVIRTNDDTVLSPQFLYAVLSSDRFFDYDNSNVKGAKMPRGDKSAVMQYQFCLPTVEKQKQIFKILDRFDMLCNDISNGLPAEIEARQKQYEYYRNKLLTFNEV